MPVVVVPMKSLPLAKGRLAPVLDASGRRALAQKMLDHVLVTLRQAGLSSIRVASGAGNDSDLNRDVTTAARAVEAEGATELLLVMADLPYLDSADIAALIEAGRESAVVIAEAKDGGTNALLLRPPTVLEFTFATHRPSAALHAERARAVGIEPVFVRRPGLARDIDTPADLAQLVSDHAAYHVFRHVA
ncbi:2-phospho-L-lactate guanylyltransferase [Reyranella sp.]|jgi:2-phospho-L-lactate guanylyltransferase|uniref:2-phospho-L-lactate guanylyltransferase n=1 Tax=Reyranella sp. TaxID=1929291 RepID=UPI002F95C02C